MSEPLFTSHPGIQTTDTAKGNNRECNVNDCLPPKARTKVSEKTPHMKLYMQMDQMK